MHYLKPLALVLSLACGTALAASAPAVETFIDAPGPEGLLKGTLLRPAAKPGPVVLIIPGSGPTDRDGNSPGGLKAAAYRLLAEGLVARGISSVRFDKRGLLASAGAVADGNAATIGDYVTDVNAWIGSIRKQTGASCVWLLGHSEGGLIALAADKQKTDICGLILVSTPGRRVSVLLREQFKAHPAIAPFMDQALPAIDALEQGKRVDTSHLPPILQGFFKPQIQGYWIDQFSYDPAKLIENHPKPVLILQGQRDLQVLEVDARLLKQADPQATLVLFPNVNHQLKYVAVDTRDANNATYADPSLPLAAGIIDAISDFLDQQSTSQPAEKTAAAH